MYKVVGVMSGTSLDGLDLCLCNIDNKNQRWHYKILKTSTLPYSTIWRNKLNAASKLKSQDLLLLDIEYGEYIAKAINSFLGAHKVDLICSHGHTVFHQPEKKLTLQIGNGQAISSSTGFVTVSDFRKMDVLLNGQGAPLVPIGDALLFPDYQSCINLGGFSNISFDEESRRIAFDICPVNIVLNYLCNKLDLEYDFNGSVASTGNINHTLLAKLNQLKFYTYKPPKSLGREWVENHIYPLLPITKVEIPDILRTFIEHISIQIAFTINNNRLRNKILFTGGGTKNELLMQCIKEKANCEIIIPGKELIDYKEALIFGFLGILSLRRETNTLKSVTGAISNSCGGTIHYPF